LSNRHDVIIIGGGIGGLTCGALLAQAGMNVLILEKHVKVGGYAHSFKRKKYTFDSGIHSVPLAKSGTIFHILKLLGADKDITPVELPEMFFVNTDDFMFRMPAKKEEIIETLYGTFPDQKLGLDALFNAFDGLTENILEPVFDFESNFKEEDPAYVSRFHNVSYRTFIERYIKDPFLQCCFFSQWPYAGASPDHGAALFYSIMFLLHFHEGTHSIEGGFSTLAEVLSRVITSHGGTVKTRAEVVALHTENKAVRTVETADGSEYESSLIVSNISPYRVHMDLLDCQGRHNLTSRRLNQLNPSVSGVSAYLGIKPSFSGTIRENTVFWFKNRDFHSLYKKIVSNRRGDAIDHLILLQSPIHLAHPTIQLITYYEQTFSEVWKDEKERIGYKMIDKANELYPGIKEAIEYVEFGSPDTFERYTGNTGGAFYGFENTHTIYGEAKLPARTHLRNFYQTGHWGKPGGGVVNVMTNAYTLFHIIMNEHR